MELFPAIDIKGGEVVRLTQGDYDRVEVYASDPLEVAKEFAAKGAKNLHMVDLDGARDGQLVNFEAVRRVAAWGKLFTQIGGGIRDQDRISQYLEAGVNRVILGTAAIDDFPFLERMLARYGAQIAVGVDARDGKVATKGWREQTEVDSIEFCQKLVDAGVATIIYTDISRDGMGKGTNLEIYRTLARLTGCNIIASGGITGMSEFDALKKMGTHGAIVGKALYTGALKLEEVLSVC